MDETWQDAESAPPRWDRLFVGAVMALILAGGLWADADAGAPRVAGAAVLGVVVLALYLAPVLREARGRPTHRRLPERIVLVVAAAALPVVADAPALAWVAYVGVGVAAAWDAGFAAAAGLAAVGMAGAVAVVVRHGGGPTDLLLAVTIGVGLFAMIALRRRQAEVVALAQAREVALAAEHARYLDSVRRRELAGQVHDALAHTLSGLVIDLQATAAAARTAGVPPDVQARIDDSAGLARQGLTAARTAVAQLRDEPVAAPAPSLADTLSGLVARSGVPVTVVGTPADLGPLDADATALACAVLVEGATNSMRHAADSPIRVELGPGRLAVISVGDPAGFRDLGHPGGRRGIIGLAERARDRDARVTTASGPAGWELCLTLPGEGER